MLTLHIEGGELFIDDTQEFISVKPCDIKLEHSLVSLARWEAKWHKPFLVNENKTDEETIDYIRCMTVTTNVDPDVYRFLTQKQINEINAYIGDPMTATTFSDDKKKAGRSREIITAELIYFWMIKQSIPIEFQKWHLNRLLTLIKVCAVKSEDPKKMSKGDLMRRNAALNAARRKQFNTKG